MEAAEDRVRGLNERIVGVVAERQALRAAGADEQTLERNRLELGRLYREVARALVARYAAPSVAA